jgi:hypothetical protein
MVLLKNQISKLILDAEVLHRSNSFGEAEKNISGVINK